MQPDLAQPVPPQTGIPKKQSRFNLLYLFLIILLIAVLFYTIPHILTPIVKNKAQNYLEKSFNTKMAINKIGFNIFTGGIILNDLIIENLLEVNQVVLKIHLPSLLRKKFIIYKTVLDMPRLIFQKKTSGKTNLDFLWQGEKTKSGFPVKELLIKDGTFIYKQEFNPQKIATAELHGIFLHLKNYRSPISHIQGIPLYTRIKGKFYIPTEPKGNIAFSCNANLVEKQKSFKGNVSMDNISLTYFNNFYPNDSQIQIDNGSFSLISQVECVKDELQAKPNAVLKNLQIKLKEGYETGNLFQLPVLLVVDFFDIYKEELKITFEVSGTLSNPEFNLEKVVAQNASKVIGESIVRTIAKSPQLVVKLGGQLVNIADKLKEWGIDLGKNAGEAIKQLEKPVEELIKGLKGE